jgi:hypothetical protein
MQKRVQRVYFNILNNTASSTMYTAKQSHGSQLIYVCVAYCVVSTVLFNDTVNC